MPRRERLRQATLLEIKRAAHAQLAEVGPAALSLRGVARTVGLAPSALYRYVASREALLAELTADAFASLADALEVAFDSADPDRHLDRWIAVARAHRRWALDNAIEYTLVFGPRADSTPPGDELVAMEMGRSVAVLFRCMSEAIGAGLVDASRTDASLTPAARYRLKAWARDHNVAIGAAEMAVCLAAWTQLHGFLTLEVFGHFPPALDDPEDLFDRQMAEIFLQACRARPQPDGGATPATITGA
ncbi:Transcriptional regulator [Frankia sp. AiPs1]